MIIVPVGKKLLGLAFTHQMSPADPPKRLNASRTTICDLFDLPEGKDPILLNKGRAFTHYYDTFQREKGRKIALRRALTVISDKKIRQVIWLAYHLRGASTKKEVNGNVH